MAHNDVRLKPGAKVYCCSEGYGLRMGDKSRCAKNAVQTAVLRELEDSRSSLDKLLAAAACAMSDKTPPYMAALALADFLLDFETFIDSTDS